MFSDIKYFFKISFPTLTMIFLTFLNLDMSNLLLNFGLLFVFQAIFFWLLYNIYIYINFINRIYL